MFKSKPKEDYLADLQERNRNNRQIVEELFVPLSREARRAQPEPGEWSVDQCFQHLVIAFNWLSPNFIPALDKPEPANSDGVFRPGLIARLFMDKQFDPKSKFKTKKANNPHLFYKEGIISSWLEQQDQLTNLIEKAYEADLQTKCWIIKGMPMWYKLGDYLNFFVSHDELHIDQAQRALAAYGEKATLVAA